MAEFATPEQLHAMTREERRLHPQFTPRCPRCEGAHEGEAFAFARPVVDGDGTWRWYAICPISGDPFFIAAINEMDEEAISRARASGYVREGAQETPVIPSVAGA